MSITARSREEVTRFFGRLELPEPGIVSCSRWRPEVNAEESSAYERKAKAWTP
ncbi:hypothetical protein DMB38_16555 [Streptomyces sp. WAC 06738]|nr:hypothetical protein DMB38_16555 [Streptomyces sp. WAC 06738]